MTDIQWQNFEYYGTPTDIMGYIRQNGCFSALEIRDAISNVYTQWDRRKLATRKVLYGADHHLLRTDEERDCVDIVLPTIENIRRIVHEVLQDLGVTVIRLEQTRLATIYKPEKRNDWPERGGWTRIVSSPYVAKIRTSYWPTATRNWSFSSPKIADERVYHLKTPDKSLIIARDMPNMQSLYRVAPKLSPLQRLTILIDAMEGNAVMHQCGWTHNDINPTNVGVEESSGAPAGVLFDLESATPIHSTTKVATTPEFAEENFYSAVMGTIPYDPARDTFAWGMTVAQVMAKGYLPDDIRKDSRYTSAAVLPHIVEDALKKANAYQYWAAITTMIGRERQWRFELPRFIDIFKEVRRRMQ